MSEASKWYKLFGRKQPQNLTEAKTLDEALKILDGPQPGVCLEDHILQGRLRLSKCNRGSK